MDYYLGSKFLRFEIKHMIWYKNERINVWKINNAKGNAEFML